jgi:hypothetical protein
MSIRKGLTTWIVQTQSISIAYRWNMPLSQAVRTLNLARRACRNVLACGPLLVEW